MFANSKAAEWAFDQILKKRLLFDPVLIMLMILSLKLLSNEDAQIKARCDSFSLLMLLW